MNYLKTRLSAGILLVFIFLICGYVTAQEKQKYVRVDTEHGSCVIALYNETPNHRDNFIRLVRKRYFDNTSFHRIINNFVSQGGDPDSAYTDLSLLNKEQKWIDPELNDSLFHKTGAVGMGRDDNPSKKSYTTQFYLVEGKKWSEEELSKIESKYFGGTSLPESHRKVYKSIGGLPHLDKNYTVFAEIVQGFDLVEKLSRLGINEEGSTRNTVWMKVRIVNERSYKKIRNM